MDKYKEVKEFISKAKNKGESVILVHGVYDLFHVGHLYSFQKAKELGDILIVGIDSDRLVRLLKGPSRPIIPQEERLEIIKNIKQVDYAFILDHPYTEEPDRLKFFEDLYKYLHPDIVAVGKKEYWYEEQKRFCEKAGIDFVVTGEIKGSTSDILERINKIS